MMSRHVSLSSATQRAMPPEFGEKWGRECLNIMFPLPTMLCMGCSVKLINIKRCVNEKLLSTKHNIETLTNFLILQCQFAFVTDYDRRVINNTLNIKPQQYYYNDR